MAIINKLDQITTNLIAAGEVIERPTSVVKELIENSIDAKANVIKVSLLDSGLKEIVVSDNGTGMDATDAKMSIESHATSKIKNGNDLFKISSLGFRGEALPSIVSVSQFRMKTSIDGQRGFMYNLKGGVLLSEGLVAYSKGTEITVKNLFFNTPARLQSLQSPNTELSYATDLVGKFALANPDINFSLYNNEKQILQTNGNGDLLETIFSVYGTDVARNMVSIFNNDGFFKVEGFVSKINTTRSSKNHITILINKRVIRNANVVNAVIRGYGERLMNSRYPIAVLDITVDVGLVDVNVHPAKLEVRFSNEKELLSLIENSVRHTLETTDMIVDISNNSIDEEAEEFEEFDESYENENEENTDSNIDNVMSDLDDDLEIYEDLGFDDFENIKSTDLIKEEVLKETLANDKTSFEQQTYSFNGDEIVDNEIKNNKLPKMDYIGQLYGTYLLIQGDDDFYVIDQHAAAERINYEKILKELKKSDTITYDLLVPFKLTYTISETILINEHIHEIKNLGVIIEDFGGGTFTVRSLPTWIPKGREIDYTDEIITSIISNKRKEKYEFLLNLAKDLACKKSIKGNEFHTRTEIQYLLEDLGMADNPYTCPHGRPVIIKFSKYEIEKWFKRVV